VKFLTSIENQDCSVHGVCFKTSSLTTGSEDWTWIELDSGYNEFCWIWIGFGL